MKTIVVKTADNPNWLNGMSIGELINGVIEPQITFLTCRAYAADALFKLKTADKAKNLTILYSFNKNYNWKTGDFYVIWVINDEIEQFKNINSNLKYLHEKEIKAGVKKTEVFKSSCGNFVVFKASGHWKNSCWKQLLYTFYTKALQHTTLQSIDYSYWKSLNYLNNEDILLSKIKTRKEIFSPKIYGKTLNQNVHSKTGFVSICNGLNPPMGELLGIKPKDYTPNEYYKNFAWIA